MKLDEARELATEFADQLSEIGMITTARFFSGTAFRSEGVQFAFVIGGTLYFRVDQSMREQYESMGSRPFTYAGAKGRVIVTKYYEVPAEILEDREAFVDWAMRSCQAAQSAVTFKPTRTKKRT